MSWNVLNAGGLVEINEKGNVELKLTSDLRTIMKPLAPLHRRKQLDCRYRTAMTFQ